MHFISPPKSLRPGIQKIPRLNLFLKCPWQGDIMAIFCPFWNRCIYLPNVEQCPLYNHCHQWTLSHKTLQCFKIHLCPPENILSWGFNFRRLSSGRKKRLLTGIRNHTKEPCPNIWHKTTLLQGQSVPQTCQKGYDLGDLFQIFNSWLSDLTTSFWQNLVPYPQHISCCLCNPKLVYVSPKCNWKHTSPASGKQSSYPWNWMEGWGTSLPNHYT